MARMILLKGIPASGKTTRAKELMADGNYVRLNKDLLRTMLHFDKWTGNNEGKTKDAERELARLFLSKEIGVLIDDTNLRDKDLQSWQQLATEVGAKFSVEEMNTPLDVCLERNAKRPNPVPEHVIVQMAMMSKQYPMPSKPFIVCDIDGTIADGTERQKLLYKQPTDGDNWKRDWNAYFALLHTDTVITSTVEILKSYADAGHPIILVSARPDTYRAGTEAWLKQIFRQDGLPPYVTLIMRKGNDKRDDDIVKRELYDAFLCNYPIEVVVDDRPRVIRMWKELGLKVIDVGKGIEF